MEENNVFGTRLRERRKEIGLTQKELATAVGAKHNSVSDWERGHAMPDPDTIVLICETLNITSSFLLPSKKRIDNESWGNGQENEVMKFTEEEVALISSFRSLDAPGKAVLQAVLDTQWQRIKEYGPAAKRAPTGTTRRVPLIQGADESEIQISYHAKRERREMEQADEPSTLDIDCLSTDNAELLDVSNQPRNITLQ